VAERDRIVRGLREEGRGADADQVKALRKPSVSAWVINQLTRQERRQVDLLLDASHRLREAQQGLLAGGERRRLDEAATTQREALRQLGEAARRMLADAGRTSETTLNRVMKTLQAAAVSPEGRELLARGRLTGDLEATGFELLTPSARDVGTQSARTRRSKRSASEGRAKRAQIEKARRRLSEARAAAQAAAKSVRAAEKDADRLRRELAHAEDRRKREEDAAARAEATLEDAERKLAEAKRRAS
jgi:hypothetical protein